jgi:hypothetical protein
METTGVGGDAGGAAALRAFAEKHPKTSLASSGF